MEKVPNLKFLWFLGLICPFSEMLRLGISINVPTPSRDVFSSFGMIQQLFSWLAARFEPNTPPYYVAAYLAYEAYMAYMAYMAYAAYVQRGVLVCKIGGNKLLTN